ncbi:hypothetical protein ElyMa_006130800 [Elysia marginata]|uniref:Uncharacterized protein n=1 Tax=Elysia marginata TaxID=1093978 RepID=A0AAV4GUW4_9GAST|nr:hypothetical protein ElyMa_006130800 [Elysia marginata]
MGYHRRKKNTRTRHTIKHHQNTFSSFQSQTISKSTRPAHIACFFSWRSNDIDYNVFGSDSNDIDYNGVGSDSNNIDYNGVASDCNDIDYNGVGSDSNDIDYNGVASDDNIIP